VLLCGPHGRRPRTPGSSLATHRRSKVDTDSPAAPASRPVVKIGTSHQAVSTSTRRSSCPPPERAARVANARAPTCSWRPCCPRIATRGTRTASHRATCSGCSVCGSSRSLGRTSEPRRGTRQPRCARHGKRRQGRGRLAPAGRRENRKPTGRRTAGPIPRSERGARMTDTHHRRLSAASRRNRVIWACALLVIPGRSPGSTSPRRTTRGPSPPTRRSWRQPGRSRPHSEPCVESPPRPDAPPSPTARQRTRPGMTHLPTDRSPRDGQAGFEPRDYVAGEHHLATSRLSAISWRAVIQSLCERC